MKLSRNLFCSILGKSHFFCYTLISICSPFSLTIAKKTALYVFAYFWRMFVSMFRTVEVILYLYYLKPEHLVLYILFFRYSHEEILRRVRSVERAGQLMGPPLQIEEFRNSLSSASLTVQLKVGSHLVEN